jgi:hypothetical protein
MIVYLFSIVHSMIRVGEDQGTISRAWLRWDRQRDRWRTERHSIGHIISCIP